MAQAEAVDSLGTDVGPDLLTARQGHELLQLVNEGLILVDRHLRITEVNQAALRMARQSRSALVGRSLSELAPQMTHSISGRKWLRAMREGRPVSAEQQHIWADGRTCTLQLRGHPTSAGFAIFYRDVTRERQSEEALKLTQCELMHASRISAMGTMAASIAHELAQPLTSAGSAIEAGIRLMPSLPSAQAVEARRALDLASASVKRGREILKRLRAFVAKGQVRARTEDLESIITDACVLVYPKAQRSGLDIRLHTDPAARWVKADAVQIQQVLINLAKNALEAMAPARSGTVTVSTAADSADLVAVTVEDSGPGLDADALANAFAPFHSRKEGGLGIGLAVCRAIVEAHGGTIEVGRTESGGAAFRFTLPRAEPPSR